MNRRFGSLARVVLVLLMGGAMVHAQTSEPKGFKPRMPGIGGPPAWTDTTWKNAIRKPQLVPEKVKPHVAPVDKGDRGQYDGYGRDTKGAIRLLRASELRQEQTRGGEVAYLENDVKIIQDSLTIWCDEARHYRSQKRLEMSGNVIMIDPKQRLDADRVVYYEDSRRTTARGNVVIDRDSLILSSSEAEYDVGRAQAIFREPFTVRDLRRNVEMRGGSGEYDTKNERGTVPVNPVLIHYDSTLTQDAEILANYMEYDRLNGAAVARDSVQLTWEEVKGRCHELWFWPDSSRALMIDEPSVWRNRDEATGDSIWLFVTNDLLDSTVIVGNAISYTPSDSTEFSPRSTLRGRRIVMDFDEGKVVRMQSDREAVGVYHIFDKSEDRGSNKVSGDRVVLLMKDGALKDVIVVGGTQGSFLPPRLAKKLRKDDTEKR